MGKGFKKGVGGANPLNFKVVGGTKEPVTTRANTIWVNTDKKITGYYFSASQPEKMADGDVWFGIGSSSQVSFNALKKNSLPVYPVFVKQYIDDALADVTAKAIRMANGLTGTMVFFMRKES